MNILLLNQTFHPDVEAVSQYLTDIALYLVQQGHAVTVVCQQHAYHGPARLYRSEETWRGVRVLRVRNSHWGKGARWRRVVDTATFLWACSARLWTVPRPDVWVVLSSPPMIAVLGAWAARLRGGRLFYWMMDVQPDQAVIAGWFAPRSWVARLLDGMARFALRRAERIIVLDPYVRQRIMAKGVAPARIAVVPLWTRGNVVQWDDARRQQFRREHALADKFVVMYAGNHSPCHPLDTLLEAARVLAADDRIRFLFMGGGSEFAKVENYSQIHRLANIICLPFQPVSRLSASLSAADMHVICMGDAYVGVVHPCKIYNILLMSQPMLYIGPERSHVVDLFDQIDCPRMCRQIRHGDVRGAVRHIQQVAANRDAHCSEVIARISDRYSADRMIPQLVDILVPSSESHANHLPGASTITSGQD